MPQSSTENKTYVVHFAYDDEDSCALTVLVNDVRFHITVDVEDLQRSREKPLYYEYLDKIYGLRDAERREQENTGQQQGVGDNNKKQRSNDKDSAIDIDEDSDGEEDSGSAGVELRNWILSAFADVTAEWAPPNREPVDSTLSEWYHGPTYFYSLQIKSGQLEPELLETTPELEQIIEDLVPRLNMPKYIQAIDVPWINANDLTVQTEVSIPEPAHPGQVVGEDGTVYFFKPVVPDQPGPIKREISILQKLAKLDVDIKVPKLLGFVSFEASKTDIIGFLLTPIPSPKPLTTLLKTSVPRAKRAEWASRSEAYVKTLHDNDIIWGDAKADNFLLDANDDLWIIDFGGSYTEGWVDADLAETAAGDDMGLDKVVKALEDPEKNTVDHGVETTEGGAESSDVKETASSLFVTEKVASGCGKRSRSGSCESGDVADGGKKRRRRGT